MITRNFIIAIKDIFIDERIVVARINENRNSNRNNNSDDDRPAPTKPFPTQVCRLSISDDDPIPSIGRPRPEEPINDWIPLPMMIGRIITTILNSNR